MSRESVLELDFPVKSFLRSQKPVNMSGNRSPSFDGLLAEII